MVWAKGQSGNPNGRPKKRLPDGRTLQEAAVEHAGLAIATLAEIAREGESEAARVSAANGILDRAFGKPTQPVAGDDEMAPIGVQAIDTAGLSEAALREIAALGAETMQ